MTVAVINIAERNMDTKHKSDGNKQIRRVAKEKSNPVAEGSLQSKAPGAGPSERGNQQSAGTHAPSIDNPGGGSSMGDRGGAGAQQSGWSARQQAERMKGRAEEARQGEAQQSGHGGAEQYQHASSQESPTGQSKAQRSETSALPQPGQGDTKLPSTDSGSKRPA